MQSTHRIRPAGHLELKHTGYWYIIIRTKNEFTSINTGAKDRAEAERQLEAFLDEARRKIEEAHAAIPLAKIWEQFENSQNTYRLKEDVRRKKRSAWLYFAEWMRDNYPEVDEAAKITIMMANKYMNHYRLTNTAGTCNNKLKIFRVMFDVLLRDGVVSSNPWAEVRHFPKDCCTRRELTQDELGRIIAEATRHGGQWHSLILFGLYTGLRLGDCCMLNWREVDIAHMILQVIPRKTKKYSCAQPVTIPIHPQLLDILERTPDDRRCGFVLSAMADMYKNHRSLLSNRLREIFTAAGIETSIMIDGRTRATPYATFHSLRHSFVSFATNSGVPLPVVQSIVGHHSSAMTRHYYHANEEALRKAVDALPNFEAPMESAAVRKPGSAPRPQACQSAHTPGAVQKASPAASQQPPQCAPRSLLERMKDAMALFKEDMISEVEFSALRRQILATA